MGYVCNILVTAYVLRLSGSNSDIMVIPPKKLISLHFQNNNILLTYLPKAKVDNFFTAMMDKFEILNLVQINRVLFLDSDIVPFCNLDYLFDLLEGTSARLQEIFLLAKSCRLCDDSKYPTRSNDGGKIF